MQLFVYYWYRVSEEEGMVYLFADDEAEARDILKRYVEDHGAEIASPELCLEKEIYGPTLMKAFPVEVKKGVAEGVSYFPKARDFTRRNFMRW